MTPYPKGVFSEMPQDVPVLDSSPDQDLNLIYYSYQAQLRRILNNTHCELYDCELLTLTMVCGD